MPARIAGLSLGGLSTVGIVAAAGPLPAGWEIASRLGLYEKTDDELPPGGVVLLGSEGSEVAMSLIYRSKLASRFSKKAVTPSR